MSNSIKQTNWEELRQKVLVSLNLLAMSAISENYDADVLEGFTDRVMEDFKSELTKAKEEVIEEIIKNARERDGDRIVISATRLQSLK